MSGIFRTVQLLPQVLRMHSLRLMKPSLSPEPSKKTIYISLRSTERSSQNILHQLTWMLVKSFEGHEFEVVDVQYWDPRRYVGRPGYEISANLNREQRCSTLKLFGPSETDVLARLRECASSGVVVEVFVYTEALSTIGAQDFLVEQVTPEQFVPSHMCSRVGSGAVLTHLPTGVSARSTFHRAHWQNKQEAKKLLAAMLFGKLFSSSKSA